MKATINRALEAYKSGEMHLQINIRVTIKQELMSRTSI